MYTENGRIYLPELHVKANWFIFNTSGNGKWINAGLVDKNGIEVWLLAIV